MPHIYFDEPLNHGNAKITGYRSLMETGREGAQGMELDTQRRDAGDREGTCLTS